MRIFYELRYAVITENAWTFCLKSVPAKFKKYLKHISWVISGTSSSKLPCNPRHPSRNISCNHRHHLLQPSWCRIFSTSNNQKTMVDSDINSDYKASSFDNLYIRRRKWDTAGFVRVHQRKYWNALTVGRGHADDGCSCNHRAVPPSDNSAIILISSDVYNIYIYIHIHIHVVYSMMQMYFIVHLQHLNSKEYSTLTKYIVVQIRQDTIMSFDKSSRWIYGNGELDMGINSIDRSPPGYDSQIASQIAKFMGPSHYHHCANFIWRHWTYEMPVRYNLSSVWVRLSIFSQLSIIHCVGMCVFSLPTSSVMIERIYILCFMIIIKSEVWTLTHCLGLGHEIMLCAVCLFIFLWRPPGSCRPQMGPMLAPWTLLSGLVIQIQIRISQLGPRRSDCRVPVGFRMGSPGNQSYTDTWSSYIYLLINVTRSKLAPQKPICKSDEKFWSKYMIPMWKVFGGTISFGKL